MSKKSSILGTVLALSGVAAATAAVYYKREEIRAFLEKTAERYFPASCDEDVAEAEDIAEDECDIVIDTTDEEGIEVEISLEVNRENEEETDGE